MAIGSDFWDRVRKRSKEPKFDYLYGCTGCEHRQWTWFELPNHMQGTCVLFPFEGGAGDSSCKGPMVLVAMRRQQP